MEEASICTDSEVLDIVFFLNCDFAANFKVSTAHPIGREFLLALSEVYIKFPLSMGGASICTDSEVPDIVSLCSQL